MRKIMTAAILSLFIMPFAFADHHYMKDEIMKCDEDKDGAISKEEFINSKERKFKDADTNSDGKLSSSEIDEMIKDKKAKKKD